MEGWEGACITASMPSKPRAHALALWSVFNIPRRLTCSHAYQPRAPLSAWRLTHTHTRAGSPTRTRTQDEMRSGMNYVSSVIFDMVPVFHRRIDTALANLVGERGEGGWGRACTWGAVRRLCFVRPVLLPLLAPRPAPTHRTGAPQRPHAPPVSSNPAPPPVHHAPHRASPACRSRTRCSSLAAGWAATATATPT